MSTDLVSIAGVSFISNNNEFYVSSREVAEKFGKNHRDIVRVISTAEQSIISANNEDFNVRNFTRVGYIDAKGENRTEILMTRDGFAFIALSLTGQAAVEWKLRFLDAFNALESAASKTNELLAEIARKESVIQQLKQQAAKPALPSAKGKFATVPFYHDALDGFPPRVEFRKVDINTAKEPDVSIGKLRQMERTIQGLLRNQEIIKKRIGLV